METQNLYVAVCFRNLAEFKKIFFLKLIIFFAFYRGVFASVWEAQLHLCVKFWSSYKPFKINTMIFFTIFLFPVVQIFAYFPAMSNAEILHNNLNVRSSQFVYPCLKPTLTQIAHSTQRLLLLCPLLTVTLDKGKCVDRSVIMNGARAENFLSQNHLMYFFLESCNQ